MERIDQLLASLGRPLPRGEEIYDLALLAGLPTNDERRAREALLAAASGGDVAAILTLGHLGGDGIAAALLPLSRGDSPVARAARRSLAQLGAADAGVGAGLARDATTQPSVFGRATAAQSLARLEGDGATRALVASLSDPDPLNRGGAFDALAGRTGVEPLRWRPDGSDLNLKSPLERWRLLLSSSLGALWRLAAAELEVVFAQLAAGIGPEKLDLVYEGDPDDGFVAQVARPLRGRDRTAPLPLDAILAATRDDRRWAEAFLAVALSRGESRAARALGALGASWALDALDEARASSTEPTFIAACDEASAALAGLASNPGRGGHGGRSP